ncbi:MAG: hypothetical protein WDN46_12225 [Methylocella sp.]
MNEIIGIASDYVELRTLIATRRKPLGLSQLAVDELAGMPGGLTGKIESGAKYFSGYSLGPILGVLGIAIAAMPTAPPHGDTADGSGNYVENYKIVRKKSGAKGGRAYVNNTTREQRRKSASHAAKTRWRKWRKAKAVLDARAKRKGK